MSPRKSTGSTRQRMPVVSGENLSPARAEEDEVKNPTKPKSFPPGAAAASTGADPPATGPADYDKVAALAAAAGTTGENSPAPGVSDAPVMDTGFGEDEPAYDYLPPDPPSRGRIPRARAGFGARPSAVPAAAVRRPGAEAAEEAAFGGSYQRGYADGRQGGGFGATSAAPFSGPEADPMYEDTDAEGSLRTPYPSGASVRSRLSARLRGFRRARPEASEPSRPGRQAQLTVSRVEPWSVMKFSFVISLVAFIVLFVAVAALYGVLSALGVFSALERAVSSITSSQSSAGFNLAHYLAASRILGYAGLLGAVNVVLITALSTVGAVLYNITADLAGGVEVTLKETD